MKHAEKLIGRILFLEGTPVVSTLRAIHIGADVAEQLGNDNRAGVDAIKAYNDAIKLAGDVGDFATRELLEKILHDEDEHLNKSEELRDQVKQMTLPVFSSIQVG